MENTGQLAVAEIPCDADGVDYVGESRIDGVPGSASPILLHFLDVAGSSCGALLPTGRVRDRFDGVEVTCIDNGMPVILLRACDLGCTGYERANSWIMTTRLNVARSRFACRPGR